MTTRIWYKNLRPELQDVGQRFNKARAAFVIVNRYFKQLVTRLGLERASALAAEVKAELLAAMMAFRARCAEVRLEREHGRRPR
jgi:thermostable 8-oxoguanine DNA glycosylase